MNFLFPLEKKYPTVTVNVIFTVKYNKKGTAQIKTPSVAENNPYQARRLVIIAKRSAILAFLGKTIVYYEARAAIV